MADKVWGVKCDEETVEELEKLFGDSEFETKKEFLVHLKQLHQIEATKKGVPVMSQDIDELQAVTRRIVDIYTGLGERINTLMKDKDTTYQESFKKKEDLISTLQDKIYELETSNETKGNEVEFLLSKSDSLNSEMVNLKTQSISEVNWLTNIIESNKALIDEYKSKNDTLTGLINEYKQYKEDIVIMNKDLIDSKSTIANLENTIIKKDLDIKDVSTQLTYIVENHTVDINRMKEKFDEETTRQKEKSEFEISKLLLDQEKTFRNEIQNLHEEYNAKVKSLLDEMEKLQRKISVPEVKEVKK